MKKVLFFSEERNEDIIKIISLLEKDNFYSQCIYSLETLHKLLKNNHFDVLIIYFTLQKVTQIERFIKKLKRESLIGDLFLILIVPNKEIGKKFEDIKLELYDYIVPPFYIENLISKIKKGLNYLDLKSYDIKNISFKLYFGLLLGDSPEMIKIYNIIKKIAKENVPVLIEGETGTGKELIAQAIHKESNRNENIFFPVNCGALPETLLESELFGHEKGAFTGATERKPGIFELARRGTIFLDEIESTPLNTQVKLLRVLEKGEFKPVGGTKIFYSDARIIAATNMNLKSLIKKRKFREDMYHRISVIKINVPPLRKRKKDIPILVQYFLNFYNKKYKKNKRFARNVLKHFLKYNWPGNVRELKNLISSLVLLSENDVITINDIPQYIKESQSFIDSILPFKEVKNRIVKNFEKEYISSLMELTAGNISQAAKIAGIQRSYLIKKLTQYKIDISKYKKK